MDDEEARRAPQAVPFAAAPLRAVDPRALYVRLAGVLSLGRASQLAEAGECVFSDPGAETAPGLAWFFRSSRHVRVLADFPRPVRGCSFPVDLQLRGGLLPRR